MGTVRMVAGSQVHDPEEEDGSPLSSSKGTLGQNAPEPRAWHVLSPMLAGPHFDLALVLLEIR